ncbi:GumC family protein [Geminicoccus roseus]|uniref:GumC family protein n=1 Tax=Geminicoccus roseus TaxID=404900 RepID=UPI0003F9BD3C|nr:AAA family ATPase [Geminicoccus roseus]
MTQDRGQPSAAEEPGIVEQLLVVRRHWPLGALMLALGIGGGALAARLIEPVFVARAEVIYEPVTAGGPDGFDQVVAAPEGGTLDSQIRQIASRAMAREVIQRLDLGAELEARGGGLGRMAAWLLELGGASAATTDVPILPVQGEPPARQLDRFLERLQGSREGKSHVFGIAWSSHDPVKAAQVANEVAQAFVTARLAQKLEAAERVEERLRQRRTQMRDAMIQAETRLELARAAAKPVLVASFGGGEEQMGALSRQLIDARIDAQTRAIRTERLKEAARNGSTGLLGAEPAQSPAMQNLLALEAQAAREEADLLAQYGERHPRLVDLRSRRKDLARRIGAEQNQILQKLDMEAELARVRADGLAAQLDAIKGDAAGLARSRQELAGLEDEARTRRQAFDAFDLKAQEIVQRLADQAPDARIVSEAVPPASPAFPKPATFMAVGGSVALALAALLAWLLESRDRSVRTARDLERITGLVTVAMVPRLSSRRERQHPHDVALDQPLGRYSEALRDMLAAVTDPFATPQGPEGRGRSVLVTSAVPEEGKTTTAISLARMAAAEGLRVVLIDGDLRHPSVLERLGLPAGPGLQEILAGRATLEQALRTDRRSGLRILPGSAAGRTALASQSGERLRQVVHSLTRDVDLVVVDAAPALAVADTKLLARSVDRVLLLARWGKTGDRLIARAVAELREVRAPLVGAVLTAVDLRRQALYGLDDRSFAYVRHARYYAT